MYKRQLYIKILALVFMGFYEIVDKFYCFLHFKNVSKFAYTTFSVKGGEKGIISFKVLKVMMKYDPVAKLFFYNNSAPQHLLWLPHPARRGRHHFCPFYLWFHTMKIVLLPYEVHHLLYLSFPKEKKFKGNSVLRY